MRSGGKTVVLPPSGSVGLPLPMLGTSSFSDDPALPSFGAPIDEAAGDDPPPLPPPDREVLFIPAPFLTPSAAQGRRILKRRPLAPEPMAASPVFVDTPLGPVAAPSGGLFAGGVDTGSVATKSGLATYKGAGGATRAPLRLDPSPELPSPLLLPGLAGPAMLEPKPDGSGDRVIVLPGPPHPAGTIGDEMGERQMIGDDDAVKHEPLRSGSRPPAGKPYPPVILGGDSFLDYWGPQRRPELATVAGVYAVLERAYQIGLRSFDVSLNSHVIAAVQQLKEAHGDVTAVGNPNWKCGIKLGDTNIYELKRRITKALLARYFTEEQRRYVLQMPEDRRRRWFPETDDDTALTEVEVGNIYLDEAIYRHKLEMLQNVADYVLVGTDYADWLIPMGRTDILERMREITKEYGFAPLSVSHWASVTLPVLDQMGFEGHWIYLNMREQFLSEAGARAAIGNSRHPITAFKIFWGGNLAHDLPVALAYLKDLNITSVVVGAGDGTHLTTTIPAVNSFWSPGESGK